VGIKARLDTGYTCRCGPFIALRHQHQNYGDDWYSVLLQHEPLIMC
jgi:hypothetical protein